MTFYPPDIRPSRCVRCGDTKLEYEVKPKHLNPETNDLIVPTKCLNPSCGITFKMIFKFDKWEY